MVSWFWEQVNLFWDIFGPGGILGLFGIGALAAFIADRLLCRAYARRDRKQAAKQAQRRIFEQAQETATNAAMELAGISVMGEMERIAARAWYGDGESEARAE